MLRNLKKGWLAGNTAALYKAAVGSSYTGPGDIVSGWGAWWSSARAYNAAYATAGSPMLDLVDQAGAHPVTINALSTGKINVAAINAWVTANSVTTVLVTKAYDQTGNGQHAVQATLANMPTLTISGLNSLPVMASAAVNTTGGRWLATTGSVTQAAPMYMSLVYQANSANNSSVNSIFVDNGLTGLITLGSANEINLRTGGVNSANVTASNDAPHAAQLLFSSTSGSSAAYVDGTLTGSLTAGTGGFGAALYILGDTSGNRYLNGFIAEAGFIAGDQSAFNSALNANQHGSTNGYNF